MTTELAIPGGETLGEAYGALTKMQQRFVDAMIVTGARDHSRCAAMAGYAGGRDNLKAAAWRLAHDPKILAAMKEQADRRTRAGVLRGASLLMELADDDTISAAVKLNVAKELLDRGGLMIESKHTIEVNHYDKSDKEKIAAITEMAGRLGLDARKLLGQAGVPANVVDAEFSVVSEAAEDPEDMWTV